METHIASGRCLDMAGMMLAPLSSLQELHVKTTGVWVPGTGNGWWMNLRFHHVWFRKVQAIKNHQNDQFSQGFHGLNSWGGDA